METVRANGAEFESLAETTLEVGGRPLRLDLQDVQTLNDALGRFLAQEGAIGETVPENLRGSVPRPLERAWIDAAGVPRFGAWLLEPRGAGLVLSSRRLEAGGVLGYQLLIPVEAAQGGWRFAPVQFERLRGVRR